jgi:hypothetical protein
MNVISKAAAILRRLEQVLDLRIGHRERRIA